MATITTRRKTPPTTISAFLGLNESTDGDTELKLGEASKMLNWRVTDGGKLKKMEGYTPLFTSLGALKIQGQWYGMVASTIYHLFAYGGSIYKRVGGVNTVIGTMTDATTSFFFFSGKVYLLNGYEYKYWDGTTFGDVAGYRPLIDIATPPAGGGTLYEEINNLTGAKRQWFSPDGTSKDFVIAEQNVTSIDYVKNLVTGANYVLTTDYTVNLVTGKVTFVTAPVGGTPNTVEIGWTKGTGDRASVYKNQFAMLYGGGNDTRVLMWGNSTVKNRFRYSALADGALSAEYFPANNYKEVGSDQHAITDIVRQYDRLIIFTEAGSYYSSYGTLTLTSGAVVVDFPAYELNSVKGNVAPGQVQLILNNPFSIQEGIYEWQATNVRDERNVSYKSKRVQPSLDSVDLTKAITFDWEEKGEYWLCVGSLCWIYNYRMDAWYQRENVKAYNFIEIGGQLYFGTDGTIMEFDPLKMTDNGTIINAIWEMNFYDFGAEYLNKYMINIWISLKPEVHTSVDIQSETNNDGTSVKQTIYFNLATFLHANFNHFSFLTSYNPQPFYVEVQAMGFCYFRLILSNSSNINTSTVLSINLPARLGGKVR